MFLKYFRVYNYAKVRLLQRWSRAVLKYNPLTGKMNIRAKEGSSFSQLYNLNMFSCLIPLCFWIMFTVHVYRLRSSCTYRSILNKDRAAWTHTTTLDLTGIETTWHGSARPYQTRFDYGAIDQKPQKHNKMFSPIDR